MGHSGAELQTEICFCGGQRRNYTPVGIGGCLFITKLHQKRGNLNRRTDSELCFVKWPQCGRISLFHFALWRAINSERGDSVR